MSCVLTFARAFGFTALFVRFIIMTGRPEYLYTGFVLSELASLGLVWLLAAVERRRNPGCRGILLLEGVQSGELTQLGPYYFRETNQPLSGSISYSIMGGEDKVKTFSMSSAGFTRNHSWTVYLYFLSTEMDFQVSWTPWEQGQDFYVK